MGSRALLVALVLVLAGCSATGGIDRSPERVTPAPVPTADADQPRVPWVRTDRTVDTNALASAHRAAVANRTYTLTVRWEASDWRRRTRIAVESQHRYRYRPTTVSGIYSDQFFVDGRVQYVRRERPLGVVHETEPSVPAGERFGYITGRLLQQYLAIGTVVDTQRRDDGFLIATATADPGPIDGASAFRARTLVRPGGFVRSFVVTYRTAGNTTRQYGFAYTDVNATTVDRPGWVRDRWGNRSSADDAA